jgi:hypothetical protein
VSKFTGAHTVKLVDDNVADLGTLANPFYTSVTNGGSGSNAAAGTTGSAVPSSADFVGVKIGSNLQGATGVDLDTGAGTEYVQSVSLRKAASGGSAELGTATDPIRTDPTNATATSVTGTVTAVGGGSAGASVAGNPIRNGVLGRTTLPTAVSSAQLVDILADRYGRQYRVAPILSNAASAGTPITTNTNTQIVAAPSSGNHLRIHRLWAQNSSATGTWVYWGNGSGVKTIPFYLAQYQPMMMNLQGSWELSTVTALYINTATTGANIEWYVEYETLAD